jgi:hypothetical protein
MYVADIHLYFSGTASLLIFPLDCTERIGEVTGQVFSELHILNECMMIFFGVMILAHDGIRLYSVHYGPKIYKDTKPYISAFLNNLPVKVT